MPNSKRHQKFVGLKSVANIRRWKRATKKKQNLNKKNPPVLTTKTPTQKYYQKMHQGLPPQKKTQFIPKQNSILTKNKNHTLMGLFLVNNGANGGFFW